MQFVARLERVTHLIVNPWAFELFTVQAPTGLKELVELEIRDEVCTSAGIEGHELLAMYAAAPKLRQVRIQSVDMGWNWSDEEADEIENHVRVNLACPLPPSWSGGSQVALSPAPSSVSSYTDSDVSDPDC